MPAAADGFVSRSALRKRKLRHGFKAAAKRDSINLRRTHGYGDHDPLDVWHLAERLEVKVFRLSEYGDDNKHVHQLLSVDSKVFSAALVPCGEVKGILVNDAHAEERQVSSLAHELAHVACDHRDTPVLSDSGCRELDADVEAEADYFSSVLLVPEPAVMRLARADVSVAAAAEQFGVSRQMMQWRYNDCGVQKRITRERGTWR